VHGDQTRSGKHESFGGSGRVDGLIMRMYMVVEVKALDGAIPLSFLYSSSYYYYYYYYYYILCKSTRCHSSSTLTTTTTFTTTTTTVIISTTSTALLLQVVTSLPKKVSYEDYFGSPIELASSAILFFQRHRVEEQTVSKKTIFLSPPSP